MTTEVNPGLAKAETIFKKVGWDTLVTSTLVYCHIDFWPLNSIVRFFTDKLYEAFRTYFDCGVIVALNGVHKAAWDSSAVQLKIIAINHGIDSPEFRKAEDEAAAAFTKFMHFNG